MESKLQNIENKMIAAMVKVPSNERMRILWAAIDQAYLIYLQYGFSKKAAKDTAFDRMDHCRWEKNRITLG